jgi:aspartokinase
MTTSAHSRSARIEHSDEPDCKIRRRYESVVAGFQASTPKVGSQRWGAVDQTRLPLLQPLSMRIVAIFTDVVAFTASPRITKQKTHKLDKIAYMKKCWNTLREQEI